MRWPAVVAVVTDDREGSGGRDVPSVSGFRGRVLLDGEHAVRASYGATPGTLVLVDPEGRQRWRKPGTKFKRPRAELVAHAVRAVLLRDADPEALERALRGLDSERASERLRALESLAELEALEAVAPLSAWLEEERGAKERRAAIAALRAARAPAALDVLARLAADERLSARTRAAAGEALVAFGDDYDGWPGSEFRPDHVHAEPRELAARYGVIAPAAEALLAARERDLRRLGARLLGRTRREDARPRLLELCADADAGVRAAALAGLAEWREEPEVRAAAESLRKDRDSDVKRLARYVLDGPQGKVRE